LNCVCCFCGGGALRTYTFTAPTKHPKMNIQTARTRISGLYATKSQKHTVAGGWVVADKRTAHGSDRAAATARMDSPPCHDSRRAGSHYRG